MTTHTPLPALADDPATIRNHTGPGSFPASTSPAPPVGGPTAPLLPEVGSEFLGFRLVQELGRGAFGRVYLATQRELAGRPVALKVSLDVTHESGSLAQLQHTNIVPVYSVHHDRGLHAVCMPYFGRTTLADVLRSGRRSSTGAELAATLRRLSAAGRSSNEFAAPLTPPTSPAPPNTAAVFDRLSGLTFPQAVCWMTARLADGLAHAHDRGIVHRDIKPANVLITDEGQPMLLDFGVAADLKARAVDATGGTIPYMAPEQLADLFASTQPADPRSDVYAVGVILFEWLSGGHPFTAPVTDLRADLPRLLADRRGWVPWAGGAAPDIPPDLKAIVRKCVAADPARRYQTAADLSEDLRRFLESEPLKLAAEPPGWYRLLKWRKRHPKLGGQLLTAGGVVVGLSMLIAATVTWRQLSGIQAEQTLRAAETVREKQRLEATHRLAALQTELRTARYRLAGRVNELRAAPADLTRLREAVGEYGLPDDADWRARPELACLSEDKAVEVFAALSDACLLLARGELRDGGPGSSERAATWNSLAESVCPGHPPRAVYSQRAVVFTRLGRAAEAQRMAGVSADTPLRSAEDHFLSAEEMIAAHRYADGLPLLREAVRLDPTHFWAQFQLGVCHHQLGRPGEARACYSAAIALRPTFAGAYFNRAVATVPLQNNVEVIADLDVVLTLEPANAPARLHRAHALAQIGDREKALDDLDAVLAAEDPGGMHVRALLQRAKWHKQSGNPAAAAADTAAALRLTPTDEVGWLLRGLARVETDPAAALDDIAEAVRLNPQYVTALRNQVYALEKLQRYEEAAEVMERAVPLAPNDTVLLASRGLLYARLGRAEPAVRDVTAALAKDRSAHVRLAAATAYALLSRDHADYKTESLKLLDDLARSGHQLKGLRNEAEFRSLATEPEFMRLTGGE